MGFISNLAKEGRGGNDVFSRPRVSLGSLATTAVEEDIPVSEEIPVEEISVEVPTESIQSQQEQSPADYLRAEDDYVFEPGRVQQQLYEGGKDVGRFILRFGEALADNDPLYLSEEEKAITKNMKEQGFYKPLKHEGQMAAVLKAAAESRAMAADPALQKDQTFIEKVARTTPQVLSQVVATMIGGPMAGTVLMGAQITGSTYENLIAQGVPKDRALSHSILNAAIQAPMEQFGIGRATKFFKTRTLVQKRIKAILEAGFVEGLTEFAQEYPDAFINLIATEPDVGKLQAMGEVLADGETFMQALESGAIGAIFGVGIGGGGVMTQRRAASQQVDPEVEVEEDPSALSLREYEEARRANLPKEEVERLAYQTEMDFLHRIGATSIEKTPTYVPPNPANIRELEIQINPSLNPRSALPAPEQRLALPMPERGFELVGEPRGPELEVPSTENLLPYQGFELVGEPIERVRAGAPVTFQQMAEEVDVEKKPKKAKKAKPTKAKKPEKPKAPAKPVKEEIKPPTEEKPDVPVEKLPKKITKEPSIKDLEQPAGLTEEGKEREAPKEDKTDQAEKELGLAIEPKPDFADKQSDIDRLTKQPIGLEAIEIMEGEMTLKQLRGYVTKYDLNVAARGANELREKIYAKEQFRKEQQKPEVREVPEFKKLSKAAAYVDGKIVEEIDIPTATGVDKFNKKQEAEIKRAFTKLRKKYGKKGDIGYSVDGEFFGAEQVTKAKGITTKKGQAKVRSKAELDKLKKEADAATVQKRVDAMLKLGRKKLSKHQQLKHKATLKRAEGAIKKASKGSDYDLDEITQIVGLQLEEYMRSGKSLKKWSPGNVIKDALKELEIGRTTMSGVSKRTLKEGKKPKLGQMTEAKTADKPEASEEQQQIAEAEELAPKKTTEALAQAKDILTEQDVLEADAEFLGVEVGKTPAETLLNLEAASKKATGAKLTGMNALRKRVKGTISVSDSKKIKTVDTTTIKDPKKKAEVLEYLKDKRSAQMSFEEWRAEQPTHIPTPSIKIPKGPYLSEGLQAIKEEDAKRVRFLITAFNAMRTPLSPKTVKALKGRPTRTMRKVQEAIGGTDMYMTAVGGVSGAPMEQVTETHKKAGAGVAVDIEKLSPAFDYALAKKEGTAAKNPWKKPEGAHKALEVRKKKDPKKYEHAKVIKTPKKKEWWIEVRQPVPNTILPDVEAAKPVTYRKPISVDEATKQLDIERTLASKEENQAESDKLAAEMRAKGASNEEIDAEIDARREHHKEILKALNMKPVSGIWPPETRVEPTVTAAPVPKPAGKMITKAERRVIRRKKAKGALNIVKNEKGGMEISIPGRDQILAIPRKVAKAWDKLTSKAWDALIKNRASVWLASTSPVDWVLTNTITKYGQGPEFGNIQRNYDLRIHQANLQAARLKRAIDSIPNVIERKGVKIDPLKGLTGERRERMQRALEARKRQVAEGGITADPTKWEAASAANDEFTALEKQLRDLGLLKDHQFQSMNRAARAKAIKEVQRWETRINNIRENSEDSEKEKQTRIKRYEDKIKENIVRLQIHYKNSGKNYLTYIASEISQVERYKKQLVMDTLKGKFAKRRRNWHVEFKDGRYRVRRKYTQQSKLLDTSSLVAKGVVQEAHDIHLYELFQGIAKSAETWEAKGLKTPWAVPKEEIKKSLGRGAGRHNKTGQRYIQIPNKATEFGPLAGMYVYEPIYHDLQKDFKDLKEMQRQWRKIFSTWKAGKTVWSAPTTFRNMVSNIALMHVVGDVNPLKKSTWQSYIHGMQDVLRYQRNGTEPTRPYSKEALEQTTLFTSDFVTSELNNADMEDYITKGIKKFAEGDIANMFGIADFLMNNAKIGPEFYQALEIAGKLTVYKEARRAGKGIQESEALAHKALFDYGDVPRAIDWMRNWYSPFVTFSYKAIPALGQAFVKKPWKLIPYYGIIYGLQELSHLVWEDDEDDLAMKKRVLPDYMQRDTLPGAMQSHVRMPFKAIDGQEKYLDLSFFFPWGGATDMAEGAIDWIPSYLAPSNPLLTAPATVFSNVDLFTGRDVTMDVDGDGEKLKKIFEKIYNDVAPAMLDLNKWDKLMGAIYGKKGVTGKRKYSVGDAMVDMVFGIKFRNIDYMEQTFFRNKELQKRAVGIRMKYSSQMQDAAVRNSNDPRNKKLEDIQSDMMRDMEDLYDDAHYMFMQEKEGK